MKSNIETQFVSTEAVNKAQKMLQDIPLEDGKIPSEKIGDLLEPAKDYPMGSFMNAFLNLGPIIVATLLYNGELTNTRVLLSKTRDGTIFRSKSFPYLTDQQIIERGGNDNNALEAAKNKRWIGSLFSGK